MTLQKALNGLLQASVVKDAKSGYRRSALSSRKVIHSFRNLLPLFAEKSPRVSSLSSGEFGVVSCVSFVRAVLFDICIAVASGQRKSFNTVSTYFCTVSESPIIVSERLGRVMATAVG